MWHNKAPRRIKMQITKAIQRTNGEHYAKQQIRMLINENFAHDHCAWATTIFRRSKSSPWQHRYLINVCCWLHIACDTFHSMLSSRIHFCLAVIRKPINLSFCSRIARHCHSPRYLLQIGRVPSPLRFDVKINNQHFVALWLKQNVACISVAQFSTIIV